MDVAKPYEFIGFGAMDVAKPYEFIWFGAMDVTKPYKCIGFGAQLKSHGQPNQGTTTETAAGAKRLASSCGSQP